MYESDVTNWVYEECVTVLSSFAGASVGTPSDHVDLTEDRSQPEHYPFIGIRKIASTKDSAGIGNGDLQAVDATYADGIVQSIMYKKEPTLRVELIPLSDGSKQIRDDLGDEISDHFDLLERTGRTPSDVETVSVEEATTEGRSEEFVYADGIPVEVEYKRLVEDTDVTAADTVNLDIDVAGQGIDNADAYDQQFSESP